MSARDPAGPGIAPDSPLARLLDAPMRPGRLCWIGLRTARRGAVAQADRAVLDPATGLEGDRWAGRPGGARQVTILARESLAAIAAHLGRAALDPALLRRNLLVEGINLMALRGRAVRIGGAVLAVTGDCHPCSRMEEVLGPGGYNAVRGHGGLTARVVLGGVIRLGDPVCRLLSDPGDPGTTAGPHAPPPRTAVADRHEADAKPHWNSPRPSTSD
ncbi:MOSC domain-containing protein [Rhizosaccharibacter radicis]|uniref:MOSC domain-containing protein n=1 Tax=Rhizosaccharibacter radicis TaxID=2782605 RepID=A0ABT1VSE5_9PROT|nr:MOSC domain-containing protein [Acetobacteraceae bacterium KSS12]